MYTHATHFSLNMYMDKLGESNYSPIWSIKNFSANIVDPDLPTTVNVEDLLALFTLIYVCTISWRESPGEGRYSHTMVCVCVCVCVCACVCVCTCKCVCNTAIQETQF